MGAAQNGQNRKERDSAHGEPPDDITRLSRFLQPPHRPTKIRAIIAHATVVAPATQSEFATRKTGDSRSVRTSDKERSLDGKSSLNGLISLQYEPAMNVQKPVRATQKLTRRTLLSPSRVERRDGAAVVILGSFSFTQVERVSTNRPQLGAVCTRQCAERSVQPVFASRAFFGASACRPH